MAKASLNNIVEGLACGSYLAEIRFEPAPEDYISYGDDDRVCPYGLTQRIGGDCDVLF